MALETVFLDAGGVLVHPNWPRVAEVLARQGLTVSGAALTRAEPRAKRVLDDAGVIRATDDASRARLLFDLVLREAGVRAEIVRLEAAWAEVRAHHARENLWALVPDEVPAALDRLRAAGRALAVVSNANGTLRALLERVGLGGRFDVVVDSTEVGVEKPDPRIFEIALERSGARRETTVHVGDLYAIDVVGARAAGLRALLLDPAGLYPAADCPRLASLTELADAVEAGALG